MSTTTTESNDILLCQCFRNGEKDHRVRIQRDPISKRFTARVLSAALRAEVLDLGEFHSTLMIAIYERGTKKRVINDLSCLLKKEPIVHACCDFRVLSADPPPPVEDDECPCGKVLADVGRTALYSGGTLETIMRDGLGIGRLEVESCLPPPEVVDGEKEKEERTGRKKKETATPASATTEPVVVLFPPPPNNGLVDDDECLPTDDDMPTDLDVDTLEELLPPPVAPSSSCEDIIDASGDCKHSSSSHSALMVPEELYAKTNSVLQSVDWASTCGGMVEQSVPSSCMRLDGSCALYPLKSKFLTESCREALFVVWNARRTTFERMRAYPKCPYDCGVDHEYTTKAECAYSLVESTFKHAVEFSTIFDQRMNWVWVDACALVMSGHRVILSVVNARADGPPLELQGCITDEGVTGSNLACVRFVLLEEGRREKELQRLRDRLMNLHKDRLLHVCKSLRINQTKYGGRGHAGETKEFVVERVMREGGIDAHIENAIALANRVNVDSTNAKKV